MHTDTAAPLGRQYDIAGRHLFLHRSGSGGPTVVFLPGASLVGLDYLNVHASVAEFTTSVLYDRAGTGWSDPVDLPRTAAAVATELRDLLRAADVPGPYVLVAHSLGGAYARRFAQLFPADVAGLVWLDAFHEDWDVHMPAPLHLQPGSQTRPGRFQLALLRLVSRRMFATMLGGWPAAVRDMLVRMHVTDEWMISGALERSTLPDLRDELQAGGSTPDVPLIALSALATDPGQALFMSRTARRQQADGKRRLYAALAASVSRGEHRPLDDARHSTIHIDRRDAVVTAIRDVRGLGPAA